MVAAFMSGTAPVAFLVLHFRVHLKRIQLPHGWKFWWEEYYWIAQIMAFGGSYFGG